jgi:hypothetical protein
MRFLLVRADLLPVMLERLPMTRKIGLPLVLGTEGALVLLSSVSAMVLGP